MKIARIAILGVAVLAAGGAAWMASTLSKPQDVLKVATKAAPIIKLSQVLVADKDIALGTKLDPAKVRWQKWPADGLDEGYIVKEADSKIEDLIKDSIVRSAFLAGEPIRDGKLIKADSGFMSAMLPSGQRAVATSISTDTGAGGFILPNDHVDVIMTRRESSDAGEQFVTEAILQNIRILAIDQTIEEKDGEAVVVGSTATLQLDPRQVEILAVAQQMADRLTLSLRSLDDVEDQETTNADHLLTGGRKGKIRMIRFGRVKETKSGK